MGAYYDELCRAMELVAKLPRSVFIGQAVACEGTGMSGTFKNVPREKLVEFPVAEDVQLGLCTGASLRGDLPVCVFPRWSFLLLSTSQLVLHLDKLPLYSGYRPKVIIRTAVPTPDPMDPGPQHLGNFSEMYASMLETVKVVELRDATDVIPAYYDAAESPRSTILVEHSGLYNT